MDFSPPSHRPNPHELSSRCRSRGYKLSRCFACSRFISIKRERERKKVVSLSHHRQQLTRRWEPADTGEKVLLSLFSYEQQQQQQRSNATLRECSFLSQTPSSTLTQRFRCWHPGQPAVLRGSSSFSLVFVRYLPRKFDHATLK